jgi:hypothetical protein
MEVADTNPINAYYAVFGNPSREDGLIYENLDLPNDNLFQ